MGMVLWRILGIRGIGYNLLVPHYPKIGGRRIYSGFSSPHGSTSIFALLYMLGLEPDICGDRTVRGLPGRYSLISAKNIIFLFFYFIHVYLLVDFSIYKSSIIQLKIDYFVTFPLYLAFYFINLLSYFEKYL